MKCIGKKRRFYILSIYVLGILFWFVLVWILRIYKTSASLILWITPIIFLLSMYNTSTINQAVEVNMFGTSYFETGLIIAIAILAWAKELAHIDKSLLSVVVVAMLFTLLGHLEVWSPVKWQSVYKHIKSVFQVFSIILFCYVLLSILYHGTDNFLASKKTIK
jgi:hypothetical protein